MNQMNNENNEIWEKCKDVLFKIISLLNDDQLVIITLYSG